MFNIKIFKVVPEFPSKVKRCRAIIFAVNRATKATGRIKFLIVSIITKNGSKILDAPWGTKWAYIWRLLFIHPWIIKLNHIGNLKVKVILICLEHLKI